MAAAFRSHPRYVKALVSHQAGDCVSGTITAIAPGGLFIDMGGVFGIALRRELPLFDGEEIQGRYSLGDVVVVFVLSVRVARSLSGFTVSVRRNAPGYVEALNAHSVGDVVSATVTDFTGNGGLWLDAGGVIGYVEPRELSLAAGETTQNRYAVGDTVHDLFVWHIDHDERILYLSTWRNAPGYVEALNAHSVGDVFSATVTALARGGGLWLDVDGVIGSVEPQELLLADGGSAQDHYRVGDTVHNLLLWQVNHETRDLVLSARHLSRSARRTAPGYLETPKAHSVGDIVSGIVIDVTDDALILDVSGVIGRVGPQELSLADGGSTQDRYAIGDTVHDLFVWQVHHDIRALSFSVRRNAPGYVEALNAYGVGHVVSATVTGFPSSGGLWLDVGGVIAVAPLWELSLAADEFTQAHYSIGNAVHDLFLWQVNHDARHLVLSVRRNTPGYVDAFNTHSVGDVVSATVTGFEGNGGLWLDVGGVIGGVLQWELLLAADERSQDRYAVGDTVHGLFVFQVSRADRALVLSVRRNTPGYIRALNTHSIGDVVSATVTDCTGDGGLWLDAGGVIGYVEPRELSLADGESSQDRYSVGDTVHGLFVWQVNRGTRELSLSVRRNASGYVEALNTHSVGDVVSATVTDFAGSGRLWLDVGGVVGTVRPQELSLAASESAQDRYTIGHTVHNLFVWGIDHDDRTFDLSVRRNAPSYVEAFNTHSVGDVVSATVTSFVSVTVTGFTSGGGLRLDVGGVIGVVGPQELPLADGETAQDHYAVGEIVHDLFVRQVNHDTRDLDLSVRRNTPGYVEALDTHSVGEVVSATVIGFPSNGGLILDVGGVIAVVPLWELSLAADESAQAHYTVGDTVHDLFLWQVNHDARHLVLSVRRNAPTYVEAFADISVGRPLDGIVADVNRWGLWLDARGVVGWIPARQLQLDDGDGESPQKRYSPGDSVGARVWQIDQASRTVFLSVRLLDTDSSEESIALGATVEAIVQDSRPGGTEVLVASQSMRVPHCELSLGIGERPHFEYGQGILVVVLALDSDGNPSALSHRRALPEWQDAVDRLARVVVVPDAQVVPRSAVPESEDRAAVDLGPVNGFVRRDELDAKQAKELMVDAPNTQYPVVVESIEANGANVIVSGAQFEERWGKLAENFLEGDPVDAEFRHVSRDRAIVDLGFGLLAEMPRAQLPTISEADTQRPARKGDRFPVRITDKLEGDYLIMAENKNQWLADLIATDENLVCEFKAVYRGTDRRNKLMRSGLPVLRAMAGMMNRSGGYVLIGVQDTAKEEAEDDALTQVIGWQDSGFKTQNSLTTDLGRLVSETLPPAAASLYEARFEDLLDGTEILVIKCEPTDSPIYLKPPSRFKPKGNGEYEFPLRYDAVTRHNWPPDEEDEMRNLREYFPQRWPDRGPQAMWDEFEEKILGRSLGD